MVMQMENAEKSLYNKLNYIIDSELERETVDTELIMECCQAILSLKNEAEPLIGEAEHSAGVKRIKSQAMAKKPRGKAIKILLVAAIIAALLTCSVFAYTFVEYKIYDYDKFSNVLADIKFKKIDRELSVGYIPDGFELVEKLKYDFVSAVVYGNDDKVMITISKSSFREFTINTEFNKAHIITENGIDYIFYGSGVLWYYNDYAYNIVSGVSEEEMLKIALSIK